MICSSAAAAVPELLLVSALVWMVAMVVVVVNSVVQNILGHCQGRRIRLCGLVSDLCLFAGVVIAGAQIEFGSCLRCCCMAVDRRNGVALLLTIGDIGSLHLETRNCCR